MPTLLLDTIAHFARTTPKKLAVHDLTSNDLYSYAQFDAAIDRAAHLLRSRLQDPHGERVAALSRNSAQLLMLHYACVRSGAIFVPINWRLAPAEVGNTLTDCEPSLLLLEPMFLDRLETAPCPQIYFDDSPTGFTSLLAATPEPTAPAQGVAVDPDTPITLLYSSGTTGKPKGIIVTQMNAFAGALNLALGTNCSFQSVFLCDMPMFHTAGLFAAARVPLTVGATLLISQKFEAVTTYQRLIDPTLGVSHYFCVTQMAMMMRQLPGFSGARLSHLTALITGGAPNPPSHILRWVNEGVPMVNGWGMTETCSALAQPLGDLERVRAHPSAVGLPHLTVELKLVNADGNEVSVEEPGEIWIRGASVTPGYWRRPEMNASAFQDGWFKTGDVAVRDSDGFYTIVDRIKDMFISGGENVYPVEIEAAISELEEISDVAVVGIADEQWGEVGCAFLVLAPGRSLDETAVSGHCQNRLAKYKIPKHYKFMSELPRTPSGKIQKHLLRDRFKQMRESVQG